MEQLTLSDIKTVGIPLSDNTLMTSNGFNNKLRSYQVKNGDLIDITGNLSKDMYGVEDLNKAFGNQARSLVAQSVQADVIATGGSLNSDFWRTHQRLLSMFSLLMLLSLVCLIPVLWMFISGFKTTQEMYAVPPKLFPSEWDFSVIKRIFLSANIGKYAFNSLCIIVGSLAFDIVCNGLAGYVLAKVRPMGNVILNTAIFWTMMLPGMSMVPLYMTFVDFPILHINLTGTFWPLWLMGGTNAFNIFLFRNFFNSIPNDYLEAARIDGCSNLGIFFKIILPLSKPIISVVTIFSVIGSWGSFFWPYLILGNTDKEPISIMLYNLTSTLSPFKANEQMLIMMLASIPAIIVYAIFSKKILGGLNMSGIKG